MKLLNHREQAWENACSTFVRDMGYHHTPNQMAHALFLGRTLARVGLPVQLHSQKIQHQFGHWLSRAGGTTWGVVRREEETVVAVQIEGLLLFPSGSGSVDHVLRQAHDQQASRKEEFSWTELTSHYSSAPVITPVTGMEAPDRPAGLSRSLSRWLGNSFRPTLSKFEQQCQNVFNQCRSDIHAQQVVHYACHLLTEAGLPCDGRSAEAGYPRSDLDNGFRKVKQFEVCFSAGNGQGFSGELNLSGVGTLFGWSYQTGDRHRGKIQEWRSGTWFPLSPPRPDNVLKLSQTLASAIREHRLEQAFAPALSANKRRF